MTTIWPAETRSALLHANCRYAKTYLSDSGLFVMDIRQALLTRAMLLIIFGFALLCVGTMLCVSEMERFRLHTTLGFGSLIGLAFIALGFVLSFELWQQGGV